MTNEAQSLITDLEAVLEQAPESWRNMALRKVADLFLSDAEHYTEEQVALFDDVMGLLIEKVDRSMLVELSNKLAPIKNAPVKVVTQLANHPDITIYGPIFEQSRTLPELALLEIADRDRRNLTLLMKILARPFLSEEITDLLLARGNSAVQRKILENTGARISEAGFARLVTGLQGDKALASMIAARKDLPAELRPWLANAL